MSKSVPLLLARDLYGPQIADHHVIDGKPYKSGQVEAALLVVAGRHGIGFSRPEFEAPDVAADVSAALIEVEEIWNAPPVIIPVAVEVEPEPVITEAEAELIAAPWSYLEPEPEPEVKATPEPKAPKTRKP